MHKFHYRAGKSAFMALFCGFFALACGGLWLNGGGFWAAAGLVLFSVGAAKIAADAMSDVPALTVERDGLKIRKTWGQVALVPWDQVQAIDCEVLTLRYMGIIPISKNETLVVRCDGGLVGSRRLRLALKLVALPAGGVPQFMALLHAAHVAAVGEARVAMAGAGPKGWGADSAASLGGGAAPAASDEGGEFDPDAALARYMARREKAEAAAPAAAPPVAVPARPAFGRKRSVG